MKLEDAIKDLNARRLTEFISLEPSPKAGRNMYICPICGSGTGRNKSGALHEYSGETFRYLCFAGECFGNKGQDTTGALCRIWNCTPLEAAKKAGYNVEDTMHKKTAKQQETADYTSFYRECYQALKNSPEALEYLHGRGISDTFIDMFNLGYCAAWKHSKSGEKVSPTKRIIIPRTKDSYTARRIDPPANEIEAQYTKQIEGRQTLFHPEALEGKTPFICEGEFDAISLYQAGASNVCALGSLSNAGKLLEEAKKHPQAVFVLALDNDTKADGETPGRKAQKKLAANMQEAGLNCLNIDPAGIYGESKDANAAWIADPERLGKVVATLEAKAAELQQAQEEERAAELRKRTGEGMLEDFLLKVKGKNFEPIKTGITDLDWALEGGFIRKTLVTLGAPPAMGKTALAQWIFENIARSGQSVLYINLEMSREQLLARSISRIVYKTAKKDFSALDILRGYAWTDEDRKTIEAAAETYKREIAPHFIYNPEGVTNKINSILTAMESETARIKAQGKPALLVCIDYLQLIDTGEKDAIEGLKTVIFKLKEFAIINNTVVLAIVANNRASNRSGVVEMESGRDTSALEYSADIALGMAYTAIEDRREYEGNEKYTLDIIRRLRREAYEKGKPVPGVCNEISVKVLKSRFTEAERRANLIFDGKHSSFRQIEDLNAYRKEWKPISADPFE